MNEPQQAALTEALDALEQGNFTCPYWAHHAAMEMDERECPFCIFRKERHKVLQRHRPAPPAVVGTVAPILLPEVCCSETAIHVRGVRCECPAPPASAEGETA